MIMQAWSGHGEGLDHPEGEVRRAGLDVGQEAHHHVVARGQVERGQRARARRRGRDASGRSDRRRARGRLGRARRTPARRRAVLPSAIVYTAISWFCWPWFTTSNVPLPAKSAGTVKLYSFVTISPSLLGTAAASPVASVTWNSASMPFAACGMPSAAGDQAHERVVARGESPASWHRSRRAPRSSGRRRASRRQSPCSDRRRSRRAPAAA